MRHRIRFGFILWLCLTSHGVAAQMTEADQAAQQTILQHLQHHRHADAERAALRWLQALDRAGRSNTESTIGALHLAGLAELWLGKFDAAEEHYIRAVRIARSSAHLHNQWEWMSVNLLGQTYKDQGRYAKAEPLLRDSLSLAEAHFARNHPALPTALTTLGQLYSEQRQFRRAQPLYLRALHIAERDFGDSHAAVTMARANLARLYVSTGQYAAAAPLYQSIVRAANASSEGASSLLQTAYDGLAKIYLQQRQGADAERFLRLQLRHAEKVYGATHVKVAVILKDLAALMLTRQEYDEAQQLMQRANRIDSTYDGSTGLQRFQNNLMLAVGMMQEGQLPDGVSMIGRALTELETHLEKNDPRLALPSSLTAILLTQSGRYDQAQRLVDRAIQLSTNGPSAMDLQTRATLHWHSGRQAQAIEDLRLAMKQSEAARVQAAGTPFDAASVFGSAAISVFDQMIAFQTELGHVQEALNAAERSRASSLIDELRLGGADLLDSVPKQHQEAIRRRRLSARQQIAWIGKQHQGLAARSDLSESDMQAQTKDLQDRLLRAQTQLMDIRREIYSLSPAYRLTVNEQQQPVNYKHLRQWLDRNNAVLLQFAIGTSSSSRILLNGSDLARIEHIQISSKLAKSIGVPAGPLTLQSLNLALHVDDQSLQYWLSQPDGAARIQSRLAALCRLLIPADLRRDLADGEYDLLVAVPDGPLALLPFEPLVVETGASPTYFLDVAPPIVYAPSSTVLFNLADRPALKTSNSTSPILSVADPRYSTDTQDSSSLLAQTSLAAQFRSYGAALSRLPNSGLEAQWISQNAERHGFQSTVLRGSEATEANVREQVPGRRVVHFACHGLAQQSFGNLFGALALTPGRQALREPADDGMLTMAEIPSLQMSQCELAILSACRTNYGPQQQGEGVWALSRGFLVAGARRVVASNWLVDDRATASLISYFCGGVTQGWKNGHTNHYARSLQAAKRWLRNQNEWSDPYFWAPFVLVGPH